MKTLGQKLFHALAVTLLASATLCAQTDTPVTAPEPPAPPAAPAAPVTNVAATSNLAATTSPAAAPVTNLATPPKPHVNVNHVPPPLRSFDLPDLMFITCAFFALPVSIVALVLHFRLRKTRILHETIRAMLDKGVPIPPELLNPPLPRIPKEVGQTLRLYAPSGRRNDLRTGLMVAAVGLALVVMAAIERHAKAGLLGFIPLFIGIAFLICWKLDQNKEQPDK